MRSGGGPLAWLAVLASLAGCGEPTLPLPDLTGIETQVVARIEEYASRVRDEPRSARAWGDLGRVLDAHGFLDEAAACYTRALAGEPEAFEWNYNLAVVLDQRGAALDEILPPFERAAAARPDYAPLRLRLGEARSRRGDHASARSDLERALALDPDSAAAHRAFGQILLALADAQGAVEQLERAVALDARDGAALAALAQAYTLAGDPDRARDTARRSRAWPSKPAIPDPARAEVTALNVSSTALAARGRAALDANRYDEALALLLEADRARPGSATVQYNIGVCHLKSDRPERAADHFRRAIAIGDDGQASWRLGELLLDQGRSDEALEHLRRAAGRAPEEATLLGRIATALARGGAPEDALAVFERAAAAGADGSGLYNNWGAALLQLGRAEEAAARFRRAIEIDPSALEAYLNAGRALETLERFEEAAAIYRRALAIEPGGAARERLSALERR